MNCGSIGRCVRGGCFCPTVSTSTVGTGTSTNRTVYVPASRNDSKACNDTSAVSSSIVVQVVKQCPGSSLDLDGTGVPTTECNGQGTCVRSRSFCTNGEIGCTVYCNCTAGWTGTGCSQSEAQAASTRELQLSLLGATVRVDGKAVPVKLLYATCLIK